MIIRRPGSLEALLPSYLALVVLVDVVQARIIGDDASSTQACHDHFGNNIPCPKQPISTTKVIIIVVVLSVVVLGIVGFFLFRVFRRKRVQTYQHLSTPVPGSFVAQGGAASGEMRYVGLQREVPCAAPQSAYNASQYQLHAPQEVKPFIRLSPTPSTSIPSPVLPPPPQAAATLYGYSAVPI